MLSRRSVQQTGPRRAKVMMLACASAVSGFAATSAHAAVLNWDTAAPPNDGPSTGTASGGTGTWDTTTLNWFDGTLGHPDVAWPNTGTDTANFGGTAGAVTVGTGITAGTINFATAGYTIAGGPLNGAITGTTGTATAAVGAPLTINTDPLSNGIGQTGTISAQIVSSSITKNGAGMLVLQTSNPASPTPQNQILAASVNAGTLLLIPSASVFGAPLLGYKSVASISEVLTIAPGATVMAAADATGTPLAGSNDAIGDDMYIAINGTYDVNFNSGTTDQFAGFSGSGLMTNSGTGTYILNIQGAVTNPEVFSGIIQNGNGKIGIRFSNARTVITLSGANTYTGGTTLGSGGTVILNNSSALGTGTFTFSTISTIDTTGDTNSDLSPIALSVSAVAFTGTAPTTAASLTFLGTNDLNLGIGAMTTAGTTARTINAVQNNLTFGGALNFGASGLIKTGDGSLILAAPAGGNGTATGTVTLNAGILQVTNTSGSATGLATINVNGLATASTASVATLSGTGIIAGNVNVQAGTAGTPANIAPGTTSSTGHAENLFGHAGALNLLGNVTLTNAALDMDLSNSAGGSNDSVQMVASAGTQTSVLTVSSTETFNFFETNGSLDTTTPYTIINGYSLANGVNSTNSATWLVNFLAAAGQGHFTYTATFSDTGTAATVSFSTPLFVGLLGDTNSDGHVDLSDLSVVLNNFGATTNLPSNGNFDGAAAIDLTDLSDVLNNFGAGTAPPSDAVLTNAAPEPASLSVLGATALLLAARRRRSIKT